MEPRKPAIDPGGPLHSPWPHRLAVLLMCATFPLLFIGGLVTSKGVGLAVPDWPTTFGYNMFLYPWSKMIGGIFYEHSHRLVASAVGLLTIFLTTAIWLREQRRWLRWLAATALLLIIVQGVLGGLRVVLLEHSLAIVHGATAQVFFALTVCLALFTSEEWLRAPTLPPAADQGGLRRLAAVTSGIIYLQIVFGAILRHTGERFDAHAVLAVLVTIHVVLLLLRVTRDYRGIAPLTRPALWLCVLLCVQLLLGVLSYLGKFTSLWRLSSDWVVLLTTMHLAVGALMLGAAVTLALRSHRLCARPDRVQQSKLLAEQFSV